MQPSVVESCSNILVYATSLRPIVSLTDSTTYQLARYLSKIISPLVGKTEYTYECVNKAKQYHLNMDKELVSFDVKSLFTSIPIDMPLTVAKAQLKNDPTLKERTMLTPDDIIELLAFCLNSTEFQFRGTFYKQIRGAAMGSLVSVLVASLVMEDREIIALSTDPERLRMHYRFVDNTISAVKKVNMIFIHRI